jgi:hypothetical protein
MKRSVHFRKRAVLCQVGSSILFAVRLAGFRGGEAPAKKPAIPHKPAFSPTHSNSLHSPKPAFASTTTNSLHYQPRKFPQIGVDNDGNSFRLRSMDAYQTARFCEDCGDLLNRESIRYCVQCGECVCNWCFEHLHRGSKRQLELDLFWARKSESDRNPTA